MRRTLAIFAGSILLAYPFLVYFGLQKHGIRVVAPFLLALFALRVFQARPRFRDLFAASAALSIIGTFLVILAWVFHWGECLLFYPVAANALFLGVFGLSLAKPPSFCERFARLVDGNDFPESAIPYARRVTQVWCALFVFNGVMALLTALSGDMKLWTLYNGAIAYVLIAALFCGERITRKIIFKK
ncbi:MAG: hypothetical protein LBG65_04785 [Puniceicoccales bacterium]|jgi:uncharacterized membrane protein|nr:hypothetical protein [Puniceicoccales bacterium]